MALEAELIYRAQDTAGRKDAAYVIQFDVQLGVQPKEKTVFIVTVKWGKWEQYRNATLTPKTEYTGTSRSDAQFVFRSTMNKREQRGYELQAHLSRFPNWLPAPLTAARQPVYESLPEARAAVKPPEPEPLPQGRVKHSRRIEL